jgi:uncharacterized protein (TIGR02246 family)
MEGGRGEKSDARVGLVLLAFIAGSNLNAQSKGDEGAVGKLPQAHCDAWNKHDVHELAKMMADDVDFVTVATVYLHGRFKDSVFTLLETTVRFLRPDMAVVHWSWKMGGDKNFDGTSRPPRFGLMTFVVEKRDASWQIVVAQNTNALLGTPPELQDIKTPIGIPGTEVKP